MLVADHCSTVPGPQETWFYSTQIDPTPPSTDSVQLQHVCVLLGNKNRHCVNYSIIFLYSSFRVSFKRLYREMDCVLGCLDLNQV